MKNVNYQFADRIDMVSRENVSENVISMWLNRRNLFFSDVVGESVTNRKALLFVQCVVSLLAMIGMAETNLFGFLICFGWLCCAAILFAKEGGSHD